MRHEKTCINTVLNQTWSNKKDFLEAQMKREYRKPYESRLPEILGTPVTMKFWQPPVARKAGPRVGGGMAKISCRRHRSPPAVFQHAVWLYLRFTLSYFDVEELLAERGVNSEPGLWPRSAGFPVISLRAAANF